MIENVHSKTFKTEINGVALKKVNGIKYLRVLTMIKIRFA